MSTAAPTTRPIFPQANAQSSPAASRYVQTIDPIKLFRKYFWVLIIAGIVGVAVGIGSYLALRKFLPQYESTVYFKVYPPTKSATVIDAGEGDSERALERFMATQAQTMVTDKVLNRAVRYPGYESQAPDWIAQFKGDGGAIDYTEAVRELQETASARPIPKQDFIVLTVSYEKAADATFVAQQITKAYMTEIGSESNILVDERRKSMNQSIENLTNQIEDQERSLNRIITENDLESLEAKSSEAAAALNISIQNRNMIRDNITSYQNQQEEYQRVLSAPGGVIYPEDIRAATEQNPRVMNMLQQIQNLQASDRSLEKQGLGINHPSRVIIQAQVDGSLEELEVTREEIMASQFSAMMDGLRRGLSQYRAMEARVLAEIDENKARLNDLNKLEQQIDEHERKIENLSERRDEIQAALDELNAIDRLETSDRVMVFQSAKLPDRMSFPKPLVIIPAGTLLFCALVAGLIVLREVLDQRVKGPADVAMIPRTPVLGMIPDSSDDPSRPERPETAFHDRPMGIMAESFRQIRVSMVKKMQQAGHRSVLVVPATPESGATSIVVNLSEACARADLKTLVVDANLRRPRIHGLFNLEPSPGLMDILAGTASIEDAVCTTDNDNLDVLTVGSAEHRMFERIVTDPMSELIAKLEARYDLVILDTAPAIVAGDAVGLAQRCGSTILVARAMTEKRGTIARLKNELTDTRAEFLGVVVNGVRPSAGGYMRRNFREAHNYQQHGARTAEA